MIGQARSSEQVALIALCGLVGLRVSEARAVKPAHFDLQNMTLHVQGKGDKGRIVPVSERAWLYLRDAVVNAAIANGNLVPYGDRFARRIITNCAKRAGLKRHVSSHDLRATYGTETYNKCLDLRVVQELLGHSSSKTTEGYTGVSMTKMKEAAEL